MTEPQAAPGPSFLDRSGDRGLSASRAAHVDLARRARAARWASSGCWCSPATPGLDDDTGEFSQVRASCCRRSSSPSATSCSRPRARARSPPPAPWRRCSASPRSCSSSPSTRTASRPTTPRRSCSCPLPSGSGATSSGPARGRPFFLGSGLIGVWFTVLEVTENVFDSPFQGPFCFFNGDAQLRDASIPRPARSSRPEAASDRRHRSSTRRSGHHRDAVARRSASRSCSWPVARPRRPPRHRDAVHLRGDPVPGGRRRSAWPTTSRRPAAACSSR